ncbi:radical SAM protein [Candidatus Woesearchaeota archaeon]|nr:radical SAM protein [Candidatus Woesearchaeota archaeon]
MIREEPFGYTLYDRRRLRHKFLKSCDVDGKQDVSGISVSSIERWSGDLTNAPKNIIYSPIRVYFEATSKCNLRCRTCFNSSGREMPGEMTTEEVKRMLDGLSRDNVLDIRFSGGEVTQRRDWYEVLKHARTLGFATSLNTNGVYDDPAVIDGLATLGLEQITISIDGGRDHHNYIRGRGNFERSVRSLHELHEKGARLRINTVLTRGSSADLEEILELAGQYVDEINFFYMRTTGRALTISDQSVSFDELNAFNRMLEGLQGRYSHVNILHGSQVTMMNSIDANTKSEFGLEMGGPDGFTRFNILPDGSIWPGGYTPRIAPGFYLGNIKEEGYSILNVWRNSQKLNEFRQMSLDLQKKCLACEEKDVRCPGANIEMELNRKNESDGKNPYCLY